jgi:hypothetical protein
VWKSHESDEWDLVYVRCKEFDDKMRQSWRLAVAHRTGATVEKEWASTSEQPLIPSYVFWLVWGCWLICSMIILVNNYDDKINKGAWC